MKWSVFSCNLRKRRINISHYKSLWNKDMSYMSLSTHGSGRYSGNESYFFGFQKVSEEIKTKLVDSLFSNVANKYDLMNDVMSLCLHRCWKEQFVKELDVFLKYYTFNMLEMAKRYNNNNMEMKQTESYSQKEKISDTFYQTEKKKKNEEEGIEEEEKEEEEEEEQEEEDEKIKEDMFCNCKILDLAGGTGDIAFKILQRIEYYLSKHNEYILNRKAIEPYYPQMIVCDPNIDMLNEGKKKAKELKFDNIIWLNEHSENLESIENDSIDIVTVSFGIRNFTDLSASLNNIYRILKPGGRFLCLEFMNLKKSHCLSPFYKFYLNNVIPFLGYIIANNKDAYKYLGESIQVFLTPEELSKLIYQTNFRNVHYTTLTCGIVAIHSAYKVK